MLSLITSQRLVELPGWTPWLILLALVVFWSEIFAMWQYPDKIFCTFSAYAQDKTAVSQFRRRFNRTCTDCNRTTNVTVHYTYWVIQVSLLNGIGDSAICNEALMQMGINSNFSFKSLPFLKVGKHPALPNHYRPLGLSDYFHSYSGCTNQRQWKSMWFCRLLKDQKRYRLWWKISLLHKEACSYCSPQLSNHYQGWRWLSATDSGLIPTK